RHRGHGRIPHLVRGARPETGATGAARPDRLGAWLRRTDLRLRLRDHGQLSVYRAGRLPRRARPSSRGPASAAARQHRRPAPLAPHPPLPAPPRGPPPPLAPALDTPRPPGGGPQLRRPPARPSL